MTWIIQLEISLLKQWGEFLFLLLLWPTQFFGAYLVRVNSFGHTGTKYKLKNAPVLSVTVYHITFHKLERKYKIASLSTFWERGDTKSNPYLFWTIDFVRSIHPGLLLPYWEKWKNNLGLFSLIGCFENWDSTMNECDLRLFHILR